MFSAWSFHGQLQWFVLKLQRIINIRVIIICFRHLKSWNEIGIIVQWIEQIWIRSYTINSLFPVLNFQNKVRREVSLFSFSEYISVWRIVFLAVFLPCFAHKKLKLYIQKIIWGNFFWQRWMKPNWEA